MTHVPHEPLSFRFTDMDTLYGFKSITHQLRTPRAQDPTVAPQSTAPSVREAARSEGLRGGLEPCKRALDVRLDLGVAHRAAAARGMA